MPAAPRRPRKWQVTFNLRREEIGPVLIAALFFFFVLTALMLLRPARDALGSRTNHQTLRPRHHARDAAGDHRIRLRRAGDLWLFLGSGAAGGWYPRCPARHHPAGARGALHRG